MKLKLTALILAAVILVMSFVSCGRDSGGAVSTDGAGRENVTTAATTEAFTLPPETADATDGSGTSAPPAVPDPAVPADSITYPSDLAFLDAVGKGHFSDKNPDDPNGCWYPGLTRRDGATGEVTYVWDRAADTIVAVDKYGAIYRGNDNVKAVYLTFDCGYEYRTQGGLYDDGVTNAILDILKEKEVVGTFFVTGDYLKSDMDIVRRMLDEGHIVGNHTMHHYNMTTVTPETFISEIKEANDLLKAEIPDAPDMVYYRPPEGGANEWTLALAHKMGLATVFWSATEPDYNTAAQPDPAQTLANDKSKLHNGCVYLLHAVSTTNAYILADLIDYIRAEGFEIRPLSEFER